MTKFTYVVTYFLPSAILYVATITFYVATLFQCVFIDLSLHLSQQSFKCRDKVFLPFALLFVITKLLGVVTFFLPPILGFVAIFISVLRHVSVLLLILSRDRVVKCHDNLSIVILHSALSLLRHSSACYDQILQIALVFCRNIIKSCRNIFYFPAFAIFVAFPTIFASFSLKPSKHKYG